jgi:hypothetical protein
LYTGKLYKVILYVYTYRYILSSGIYPAWRAIDIAREAQPGRAELWRCLGCKFKSYLEQFKGSDGIGRHE